MSIRGIGDGFAFQRLLWLLVGTVIVPTVLLSLFGVAAIRNQGAAVLHELDRLRAERLEIGARTLASRIAAVERTALERARCAIEPCRPVAGTSESWVWDETAGVPEALEAIGVSAGVAREASVVWIVPVDGSAPVVVVGREPLAFAWRLDPAPLQLSLDDLVGDRLPEHVSLHLAGPEPGSTYTIEDVLTHLSEPEHAVLDLPRPLSGWRLVLDDAEDPSRATVSRNSWLYPASLVILVCVVLVGTVITLGSATREIRLSRLQTDFVSNVSHELRTPLTSIRVFVETLQSGRLRDPDRVRECLDLVALETDRLSRMIERVLDWARMEAGRRIYEFEPVAPAEIAHAALLALRTHHLVDDPPDPDAPDRPLGAAIQLDVPPDLPELMVDRDAIVEALLNLLHNAVKHTAPPRRIAVRAARRGRWIGLTVEDDGPGIPKRDRRRIFEKFYQVDARLSSPTQGRVDRGSGLGLSIVRAVARAHGGKVELDSEVGRGSRFTLWLPAVDGPR
ncbi:MAG: HAMP domain-containing sensor histidine kinase [Myxococcota bacterium]